LANGDHDRLARLRGTLRELYQKQTPRAVVFRYSVLFVDTLIIGFFIAGPIVREASSDWFYAIDYFIAFLMILDLAARALSQRKAYLILKQPIVWVDIFIIVTLLFPVLLYGFAFMRVLRLWSVIQSEFFWRTIGRKYDDTGWEDVIKTAGALITFVFIVTGFVYTTFGGQHEKIVTYIDALYFTVSTLSTTGFGDIVLPGNWGKILSIVIMVSGITLFVRLAQTLLRPHKVRYPCPQCGLIRHEPDAVHCKACGFLLNIPNED
jgi:voltage-gated potassium channel